MVDVGQWDSVRDGDSSSFFFSDENRRWPLVQPDSKPFQFSLDDLLVTQRLEHVEYDEDKIASSGDWIHDKRQKIAA